LFGLWWGGDSVPAYSQMMAWSCAGLLGALFVYREFRQRMKKNDDVKHQSIGTMFAISLPMLVTSSMAMVIGQASVIILGMYRSVEEVGYYAAAVRLATLTSLMLNAINTMSAPVFSELFHQGQHDELFRVAKKSVRLIFWLTIPVLTALLVFGRPVLALFGPEFSVAYPALAIMLIGQFVYACAGSTAVFMNMTGNQNILRNIMSFTAVFHLLGTFILTRHWGMLGASVAITASTVLWNVAALYFVFLRFGKTILYVPRFVGQT
jgi:O-antigen/teichoic acid export membrane protein